MMKDYTEKKALELLALPCLGYRIYSPNGDDCDCEYPSGCLCEDCICNFGECNGHIDPRTNHPVSDKILKKMQEIYTLPYRRMKDNPLTPEQFQHYLEDLKYWVVPEPEYPIDDPFYFLT